jgi:site-specific recombinase XerD
LTREEVEKFLTYLADARNSRRHYNGARRNLGMATFLLETGLRVGELSHLQIGDVLFSGQPVQSLLVRAAIAKLHVERRVPVSRPLAWEITTLRDTLWLTQIDRPGTYLWYRNDETRPLTTRSIEAVMRNAGLASIGRPVYPHMLRHTFATNMMRVTSARIVQELLGHASIRSTQIYTHPNGDDLAAAIAAKDAHERKTAP